MAASTVQIEAVPEKSEREPGSVGACSQTGEEAEYSTAIAQHLRSLQECKLDVVVLPALDRSAGNMTGCDLNLELFSRREREVIRALAVGKKPKEICRELGISELTVRNHLQRAYCRLGVHSARELLKSVSGSETSTRATFQHHRDENTFPCGAD